MNKLLHLIFVLAIACYFSSCSLVNGSPNSTDEAYVKTTASFTNSLMGGNYDACVNLLNLTPAQKSADLTSLRTGLDSLRSKIGRNFGGSLQYSFMNAQTSTSNNGAYNLQPGTTLMAVEFNNGKDIGSPRKGGKGGSDIYHAVWKDGIYLPAENLGDAINGEFHEYEAYIAPDESYIIFNRSIPNGLVHLDFYISYNKNGAWTKAIKIPSPISSDSIDWSPKVTHDGKYFYFSSSRSKDPVVPEKPYTTEQFNEKLRSSNNGLSDIYIVDFKAIESALKTNTK